MRLMLKFSDIAAPCAFFLVITCGLFSVGTPVSAHVAGASVEQVVDGRLVDIGYSPEVPRADEQIRLDFAIYKPDTREALPFTDIWVRIIDANDRLLFAGGLNKAEFGLTGLTYLFPTPGPYKVFARFSDGDTTVVEATAEITIGAAVSGSRLPFGVSEALAFLAGAIIAAMATVAFVWRFGLPRRKSATVSLEAASQPKPEPAEPAQPAASYRSLAVSVVIGLMCAGAAFYTTKAFLSGGLFASSDPASAAPAVSQPVQEGTVSIVLTKDGFSPAEVTIKKGTTIVFSTDAGRPFWPASNLHPTHELYPAFDPKRPIPPEETWSFTFDQAGDWNMHDHLRSYFTGTIHVVE